MKYPKSIQNLINMLTQFPTVGPKTAERYVFYLLKQPGEKLQALAQAIAELKEKTKVCQTCYRVAESSPCSICSDNKRNQTLLCVVANTRDMLTIEATKEYLGHYHILGGTLDAIEGIKPENLKIKELLKRIGKLNTREIILALNPTMEGETTTMYLTKLIKKSFSKIKITRLAKGLPMGADLEYADEITLSNALKYRNEL
jgi:recombination protein RecR